MLTAVKKFNVDWNAVMLSKREMYKINVYIRVKIFLIGTYNIRKNPEILLLIFLLFILSFSIRWKFLLIVMSILNVMFN